MALKPCKECKHQASRKAKNCPNCGVDKPTVTVFEQPLHTLAGFAIVIAIGYWIFGGDDDTNQATQEAASTESSKRISKDSFGRGWPLSVDSGVVMCLDRSTVVFVANGKTFAVNGFAVGRAKKEGYANIDDIWLVDHQAIQEMKSGLMEAGLSEEEAAESVGEFRIDISPILDTGLALCD